MLRIGHGYDVHRFGGAGPIILGGVSIDHPQGFIAHSDGDVLLHAVCDALLGAAALGDIGHHFPDSDQRFHNINSRTLLAHVVQLIQAENYNINNIDITVIAEKPKLAPHIFTIRTNLAHDLQINIQQINVKATTTEQLGFVGRKEGVAVHSIVLIEENQC